MAKKKAIMRTVLTCFIIFAILVSVMPVPVFAMNSSNNATEASNHSNDLEKSFILPLVSNDTRETVSALSCDVYIKIDDDTCVGYDVYVDGVYQFTEGQSGTPDGYCAFYVSAGTHKFELRKNGCTTSKSWYCQCGTVYRWVSMPDNWCRDGGGTGTCINFDELSQGDITGQTLHYDQVDFVAESAEGSVGVLDFAHSPPNGIALFGGRVTANFKAPVSKVSVWVGDWAGGTKIALYASDGELLKEESPRGDFTYYEFSYAKKVSKVVVSSAEGAFDDFCFEIEGGTPCKVYVIIDDDTCSGYEVYVDGVYQFTEGQSGTPDGYCAFYVSAGTHKFELRKNGCSVSKSWYCQCGTTYRWVSMNDMDPHWCDSHQQKKEVKFRGIVTETSPEGLLGEIYWYVSVDEWISGSLSCDEIYVTIGMQPPFGSWDENINKGDSVKVYGVVDPWGGRECTVGLNGESYYIKKIESCGEILDYAISDGTYPPGQKVIADMKYKSLLSTSADFKGVFKVRSPTGDIYTYNSKKESTPAGHEDRFGYNMGNHFTIQIPEDASLGWYDAKLELRNFYTDELCDETEWLEDQFKIEPSGATGGDIRITNDPAESVNPKIAVDLSNNIHIVWEDSRDGNHYDIYYTKLDNKGNTLVDDKRLTHDAAYSSQLAIATDSTNNVHITWVDTADWIYYTKLDNDGNILVDNKKLTVLIGYDYDDAYVLGYPHIANDSSDNIHVVWDDGKNPESELYYMRLDDNGKKLVSDKRLTFDSELSWHQDIVVDSSDNIHIAWVDYRSGIKEVYYTKLDSSGNTLIDDKKLTKDSTEPWGLTADIDSNDNIHITWSDSRDGIHGIYYSKLDKKGNILVDAKKITSSGLVYYQSIAVDSNNDIDITWWDSRDGNEEIYYTKLDNNGNILIDDTRLTYDPAFSGFPDIAVDSNDKVHITWQDDRDGNWEIYYKTPFAEDRDCFESVPSDHWKGEYHNNMNLDDSPSMVRDDGTGYLNFDWGSDSPSTSCGINSDSFSVRWSRSMYFDSGTWRFTATTDDGMRVYVDGSLVIDKWFDQTSTTYTADVDLTAGTHTIIVEYYENGGTAIAKLSWEKVEGLDLVFEEITFSDTSPRWKTSYFTDKVKIITKIKKIGKGNVDKAFTVRFDIESPFGENPSALEKSIDWIPNAVDRTVIQEFAPEYAGTYEISVTLDSKKDIPEYNEDNNEKEITLDVNTYRNHALRGKTTIIFLCVDFDDIEKVEDQAFVNDRWQITNNAWRDIIKKEALERGINIEYEIVSVVSDAQVVYQSSNIEPIHVPSDQDIDWRDADSMYDFADNIASGLGKDFSNLDDLLNFIKSKTDADNVIAAFFTDSDLGGGAGGGAPLTLIDDPVVIAGGRMFFISIGYPLMPKINREVVAHETLHCFGAIDKPILLWTSDVMIADSLLSFDFILGSDILSPTDAEIGWVLTKGLVGGQLANEDYSPKCFEFGQPYWLTVTATKKSTGETFTQSWEPWCEPGADSYAHYKLALPPGDYTLSARGLTIVSVSEPTVSIFPPTSVNSRHDDVIVQNIPIKELPLIPGVMQFLAKCPIDMIITDPNGNTIKKDKIEISNCFYDEFADDGGDLVTILEREIGEYRIVIVPDISAKSNDTFSLKVLCGDQEVILAKNVSVSEIPDKPYIISSTETGITAPLLASFTFSPVSPVVNETVTFDASDSKDTDGFITNYKWDFGDGNCRTGTVVTHLYANTGTYSVTLTVEDNEGNTDANTQIVEVKDISPTRDIPISTAANSQLRPTIAYNRANNEYLVTWDDKRSGSEREIYAQRVSGANNLVESNFAIALSSGTDIDEVNPFVAYNPTANEYLVVWNEKSGYHNLYYIYAQRVSHTGSLVGDKITVSSGDVRVRKLHPTVAYNPANNEYLVVWYGQHVEGLSYRIYGQRLSSSGSLLASNFAIGEDIGKDNYQYYPQVVYNAHTNDYLVVWEDMRNGGKKDIYAQKVSGSGSLLGSNYCICNAANEQEAPSVAYNSADNQYLVTWQDGRTGSNGDIYAQMISGAGNVLGNEIAVRVGSGTSLNPSVTYNSKSNVYFVAWEETDDIFALEITSGGGLSGSSVVICDASSNQGEPSVAYNSANNLYFVTWQDYRNGNFDIYGAWAVPQRTNQPPINPSLTPDKQEPQTAGTSITWTASATDSDGDTLYYRFWIKSPSTGDSWAMKRDWSTDNTWTWDTNSADIGDTDISVWIRDGHHEPLDKYDLDKVYSGYNQSARNKPPANPLLTSDKPEPQTAGTSITWTASATDPDGDTLYYRFWTKGPSTGDSWTMKRDWSTDNTWAWHTSSADVGDTDIAVRIRDGHHAPPTSYDLEKLYYAYTIEAVGNQPPANPSLASNKAEPQTTGTAITWTASATDPEGDTLYYRFWTKGPSTGDSWTIIRDWSTDNTWTWHTSTADIGDTDIAVRIRDGYHAPASGYDLEKICYDYAITGSAPGLVAEWHFDEGSGSTVKDNTGNGNDGIIHGATWVNGIKGNALKFDGKDDYVEVQDSSSLRITGNINVEAWVNVEELGSKYHFIVSKHYKATGYTLFINPANKFAFEINGQPVASTTTPELGKWYHVVGTYDQSQLKIYVNDVLENTKGCTAKLATNNQKLRIGRWSAGGYCFKGIIDEVSIYANA